MNWKSISVAALLACVSGLQLDLKAEPVAVKFQEGTIRGFLSLRNMGGKLLASGDLTQVAHGDRVVSHVVFRFRDGSIDDETATFSQRGTFRLISDQHAQKGPMYPKPMDVRIDVATRRVVVRYEDKGQKKVEADQLDLPDDLANGMILNIVKNIPADAKDLKVSWVAATPKPRIVKLSISSAGANTFLIAGVHHEATRFDIKIEIGGLAGLIAPVVGKAPADINAWISNGVVPAFVKSEGPLFLGGPIWRIELSSPTWPSQEASQ